MSRMTYWHEHLNGRCEPVKTPHLEEQEKLKQWGFHQLSRESMIAHLRWIAWGRISAVPTFGGRVK